MTEPELLALLDIHDRLLKSCLVGDISIEQFVEHYDKFPESFALDGHESSKADQAMLEKHGDRVRFHYGVLDCLRGLCSEEEAELTKHLEAGRFGRAEAFRRLHAFCRDWRPPAAR